MSFSYVTGLLRGRRLGSIRVLRELTMPDDSSFVKRQFVEFFRGGEVFLHPFRGPLDAVNVTGAGGSAAPVRVFCAVERTWFIDHCAADVASGKADDGGCG